jgi:hypothetical protein
MPTGLRRRPCVGRRVLRRASQAWPAAPRPSDRNDISWGELASRALNGHRRSVVCHAERQASPPGARMPAAATSWADNKRIPCSCENFPCFYYENSLLRCAGKKLQSPDPRASARRFLAFRMLDIPVFPVIFPVSREFGAETGSRGTASSASQSDRFGSFPVWCEKSDVADDRLGLLFAFRSDHVQPGENNARSPRSGRRVPARLTVIVAEPKYPVSGFGTLSVGTRLGTADGHTGNATLYVRIERRFCASFRSHGGLSA